MKIYSEYKQVPLKVLDYISRYGLVQHYPNLGEAFCRSVYKYHYAVATQDESIVGIFPYVTLKKNNIEFAFSIPYYSYGGISAKNEEVQSLLLEKVQSFLTKRGTLTLSISEHPFHLQYSNLRTQYRFKNFYQYIELEDSKYLKRTTSKFRNNLKRNLKKAQRENVKIRESKNLNDLKKWYLEVYLPRLNKTSGSIYPYEIFEALLQVPNQRCVFLVVEKEDSIIGGAVCLEQHNVVDLFMRVISTDYLSTQAGTLLDYYIISMYVERGFKYLNWQSTDAVGSNIYSYKESWGSRTSYHNFQTLKLNSFSKLNNLTLEELKDNFHGMFVAPYDEIEKYLK